MPDDSRIERAPGTHFDSRVVLDGTMPNLFCQAPRTDDQIGAVSTEGNSREHFVHRESLGSPVARIATVPKAPLVIPLG